MAGWIVACSRDDSPLDSSHWSQSVRVGLRYGGAKVEHRDRGAALAAWRRASGEFSQSGSISSHAGAFVAWIGQCIEDKGDATSEAISLVAQARFDDRLVSNMNGPFAAAIVRSRPFEVRVVTDRHRHYPVYVYRGSRVLVASTEMRCIVPWLSRARIDLDSFDMLLRCGELIDRMTMLEQVEMLPPATVLTASGSAAAERRYWVMRSDGADAPPIGISAKQLAERLRTAVRRIEAVTPRLGITLSGGLDSRMILDLCSHPDRVPSYTWGLPGCRDITCATKFASVARSAHTVRHWEPNAFLPLWSRGVDLTAGGYGVETMFMLPFVDLLRNGSDVVLNGLAGDVILGGNWVKYSWLKERSVESLGRQVWRWRVPEHVDLAVDRLTGRSGSGQADRWAASLSLREGGRPIERLNDWLVENRIFRTTNAGTMLLRGGVESHAPFFDRDFIDTLVGIRHDDKYKHKLYLQVMNLAAPRAASVAWQRTNLPPAMGYYANLASMAFHSLATKAGQLVGVQAFKSLMVAAPAAWLRVAWRSAVENILFSKRANERGLVDPAATLDIWKAHLRGDDLGRQLGVLLTAEIFSRQVIDGIEDRELSSQAVEGT